MSKVYLVLRDDGNVCCPAAELDSVWSTKEQADARKRIVLSAGTSAHVDAWTVDGDIVGQ